MRRVGGSGAAMAVLYSLLAVVMTWPVSMTAGTRLASDLGDPVFVSWALAWDAGQMLAALRGDVGALAGYWNANIFYPEPLTLAYSEHFTAQALQILPVYAATGNIILAYNLLFVSTFALSGLAVYLLVRDLTGRALAAFLAGLAYAYAPYRMGQFSHLQVLSSYWMPFALYGFHRYFAGLTAGARGRALFRPLSGAAAAVVMQNLSCGYFMLFFAPFVPAYCLYEMVQRRLVRTWRVWRHLGAAGLVIACASWPFIRPYMEVRKLEGLGVRTIGEIVSFSADVHAFATVSSGTHLFGDTVRSFVKPEGEGFPGFTILAFAAIAIGWGIRRSIAHVPWRELGDRYAILTATMGVVWVLAAAVVGVFFVYGYLPVRFPDRTFLYHDANPALITFGATGVGWLVATALARRRDPRVSLSAFGFFSVALLVAAFLALGPRIEALGHRLGTGPYSWLLTYAPGWEGLRVPARFLMLVALFLSVLAGLGAAEVLRTRYRRFAAAMVLAGCLGIMAEAWVAPVPTNLPVGPNEGLEMPPPILAGRAVSPIYRVVRDLPGRVVLAEFPFGDPAYELRAVYYAGFHLRPILNGFSGYFPAGYAHRSALLADALTRPSEAAEALRDSGATHALVHERAFSDDRGPDVSRWLESLGARLATVDNGDALYVLP